METEIKKYTPTPGHVAAKYPFSTGRRIIEYSPEDSLLDIAENLGLDRHYITVAINGHTVKAEYLHVTRPKVGQSITIVGHPKGDSTNLLRTLAIIAISIYAPYVGFYLGSSGLATTAWGAYTLYAVGTIGAFAVGMLAVNAFIPLPTSEFDTGNLSSQSLSITASRNRLIPFGTVPYVLGKMRFFPPMAARPYTEVAGEDIFVRELLCLGYKNMEISNLQIGETPIGNYEEVEYEVISGGSSDATKITTYATDQDINEYIVGLLTTYPPSDGYITRTTGLCDEIQIDLAALSGLLIVKDQGSKSQVTVTIDFQYAVKDSGSWVDVDSISLSGKSAKIIRASKTIKFPSNGQYDIRVWRTSSDLSPDDDKPVYNDDVTWTVYREINYRDAVNKADAALMGLRIRASDQLNGTPDTVNCIAYTITSVWTGSDWGTATTTNNPAALFRLVLMGNGNAHPITSSRVDDAQLGYWYEFCVTNGFTCNIVIDYSTTVFEVLKIIAATGRARPVQIDGKWTVVIDEPRSAPIQIFSARNSTGYTCTKAFYEIPDAFRIRFIDETSNYENSERLVYRSGESEATAETFESMELMGVTNPDQIFYLGNYYMRAAIYRPELHNFKVDVEYLVCTIGDYVEYQQDAIYVGLASARVLSATNDGTDTTVTIDAHDFSMDGVTTYGIGVRHSVDGSYDTYNVDSSSVMVESNQVVILNQVVTDIIAGDLVVFGEIARITIPLMVQNIRPGADLSATLTCVQYNEVIYNTGAAPPYDPLITFPPGAKIPTISSIISDESALVRDTDGSLRVRMLVNLAFASARFEVGAIEGQSREYGTTEPWDSTGNLSPNITNFSIFDVEELSSYEVRVRYIFNDASFGEWYYYEDGLGNPYHTVIGKTSPPPDVDQLEVSIDPDGTRIFAWTYSKIVPDLRGYEIRYYVEDPGGFPEPSLPDWGIMTKLHEGILVFTPFETNSLLAGWYHFAIKAIDTSGNYSQNATYTYRQLSDQPLGDLAYQELFRVSGWSGIPSAYGGSGEITPPASSTPTYDDTFDCIIDPSNGNLAPGSSTTWANRTTWAAWTVWNDQPLDYNYVQSVIDLVTPFTFSIIFENATPAQGSTVYTYYYRYREDISLNTWTDWLPASGVSTSAMYTDRVQVRLKVTNPILAGIYDWGVSLYADTIEETVLYDPGTSGWDSSGTNYRIFTVPVTLNFFEITSMSADIVSSSTTAGWTVQVYSDDPTNPQFLLYSVENNATDPTRIYCHIKGF